MPGLLNVDPTASALTTLGAGMVRGDFGGGLLGANEAIQNSLDSNLKRQDLQQQIALRNLQLQQQQQQWALQQPLLARLVNSIGQGDQAASGPVGVPAQPAQPATMPTPGGPMGSGTFNIPTGGQPASAPPMAAPQGSAGAHSGSMLPGVPDSLTQWAIATGGIGAVPALLEKFNQPTEFQRLLIAQGIDPSSPQGQALMAQQVKKLNNIPLQAGRAGAPMYNPDGTIAAMAPKIPDNAIPQIIDGRVVGVSPLPGGANVEQMNAYAQAAGKAQTKPIAAYRGNQPVFTNELEAAQGGNLPPPQPGVNGNFRGSPDAVAAAIANIKDPQERANAQAAFDAQMRQGNGVLTPQPALGAATGQENAQNEVSKRWQALVTQNQEAQNTKSYLDSIKQMATKAAVGPFTDKLQFTNALLSLVGNEKATDATTANALLDKYSNQIVARLGGSGGLATDSARSILQSAYPNAHMTPQAISEAADNLNGAMSMVQAKAGLLEKHANARDPAAYSKAEIQFDQNADPRLWQLKNMDAASAQKWLSSQPASVQADLRRRAGNLKLLGVL